MRAQVLQSLVGALKLLAGSRAPPNSAGIELLLAARGDGDGAGALPPNLATPSNQYVRREAQAAWGCMQARPTPCRGFCLFWPSPAACLCGTWRVLCEAACRRAS